LPADLISPAPAGSGSSNTDPVTRPEARSITARVPNPRIAGEPVDVALDHRQRLFTIDHRPATDPIGDLGRRYMSKDRSAPAIRYGRRMTRAIVAIAPASASIHAASSISGTMTPSLQLSALSLLLQREPGWQPPA